MAQTICITILVSSKSNLIDELERQKLIIDSFFF